jgi:hypothetical protein
VTAYATSVIRTVAGYVVGAALALPIAPAVESALGVSDTEARTGLAAGVVLGLGTGYYALVRRVETRWPKLGRFLGVAAQPAYPTPAGSPYPSAQAMAAELGAELVPVEADHSSP